MNRRAFFGALATCLAWFGVKPAKVEAWRLYRLDAENSAIITAGGWNTQTGYRVSLWDGDHFVKVVTPVYLGRAVTIPIWTRKGKITESSFVITGRDARGLAQFEAQYEYGPKWWKSGRISPPASVINTHG